MVVTFCKCKTRKAQVVQQKQNWDTFINFSTAFVPFFTDCLCSLCCSGLWGLGGLVDVKGSTQKLTY